MMIPLRRRRPIPEYKKWKKINLKIFLIIIRHNFLPTQTTRGEIWDLDGAAIVRRQQWPEPWPESCEHSQS